MQETSALFTSGDLPKRSLQCACLWGWLRPLASPGQPLPVLMSILILRPSYSLRRRR